MKNLDFSFLLINSHVKTSILPNFCSEIRKSLKKTIFIQISKQQVPTFAKTGPKLKKIHSFAPSFNPSRATRFPKTHGGGPDLSLTILKYFPLNYSLISNSVDRMRTFRIFRTFASQKFINLIKQQVSKIRKEKK